MTAHKHAENMRLYSEDAAETDTPWDRWEYKGRGGWINMQGGMHPHWYPDAEYRRKPKTIRIGERDVPAPMTTAPEIGSTVWITAPLEHKPAHGHWDGSDIEMLFLKRGLCHTSKENAQAHAEALILVSGGTL